MILRTLVTEDKTVVANARDFLFAIKESTHTVFDADAVEFLDALRDGMSRTLDAQTGLSRDERDGIFFFEGMLRGVQLQLKRKQQHDKAKLAEMGLLGSDGNPRLPEA